MLIKRTDDEMEIWKKQMKIIFILKRKIGSKNKQFLDHIENTIFDMSVEEIELKYSVLADEINKEIWVDCYPMLFHVSEFNAVLNEQLYYMHSDNRGKYNVEMGKKVEKFLKSVEKEKICDLSLQEKIEIFWITHSVTY